MANELAQKITNVISPGLGEFIAHATVSAACIREKATADTLTKELLPKVAVHIEDLLTAKVGPEAAKAMKAKILAL
jgi:hypothetical protein